MDDRFDTKRNSFVSRMTARKGIFGVKGHATLRQRQLRFRRGWHKQPHGKSLGGDSLTNDSKSIMPLAISKKDGYE